MPPEEDLSQLAFSIEVLMGRSQAISKKSVRFWA
jgi:hypothetical protein